MTIGSQVVLAEQIFDAKGNLVHMSNLATCVAYIHHLLLILALGALVRFIPCVLGMLAPCAKKLVVCLGYS